MPEEVKSSWADEVEDDGNHRLPDPTETVKNGVKILTEYKYNEDNKKVNNIYISLILKTEYDTLSKDMAAAM